MSPVDAFLCVTIASHLVASVMPVPLTEMPYRYEKLALFIEAVLVSLAVILNVPYLWVFLGVAYSILTVANFTMVKWREKTVQMFLTCWDLFIAISCFIKF